MSRSLRISPDLSLPVDVATHTFAILAQRRKGKTYTAAVVAEEMAAAKIPWIAFDPTGAWWGLRASADGKSAGLPVLVVGGEHGQLPLERGAGKVMADLVVEHPGWYVFDFSGFESKSAERQFATDFAERFYRRKAKDKSAVHFFVDEADMFVPQRSPAGDQRMLGAFEALVRRGGIRGIGVTLISQRAAVVNKNVLEQIDDLIVLRTVGPRDRKAIADYVEAWGSDEEREALMGSLASLDLGEAWIWEPGGDLFERVKIRERETFNSSATGGGQASEPRELAEVDLDVIRAQIAETVEKAEADDPSVLRRRIKELERKVAERPEVEKVEVPLFGEQDRTQLGRVCDVLNDLGTRLEEVAAPIDAALKKVAATRPTPAPPRRETPARRPARPRPAGDGDEQLPKAPRALLQVLVERYPMKVTKAQLSTLSGYKPRSSTFRNALSALRTRGYMTDAGGDLEPTDAGFEAIGGIPDMPTPHEEVIEKWRAALPQAPRVMLDLLLEAYPNPLDRDELAEQSGYSITSSTFRNALSALRTNGLLDDVAGGAVQANETIGAGQ